MTLTCTRQKESEGTWFWIRLVSGHLPEVLGGTFDFDYHGVNEIPRIITKQGPGTFLLHISETQRSDTGVYYCINVDLLNMKFLNATFLRIKGK